MVALWPAVRDIRWVKNDGGDTWFKRFSLLYFARAKRDKERERERDGERIF
jgi:hypothetical protein